MKQYEKPTLETIVLTGDVITTSGGAAPEDCVKDCVKDCIKDCQRGF